MVKPHTNNLPSPPDYQNALQSKFLNGIITHTGTARYPKELATHKAKEQACITHVHSGFSLVGTSDTVAWQG